MKFLEATKAVCAMTVVIAVMSATTSCDSKSGGGNQNKATVNAEKRPEKMSLPEKCEAEFRQVINSINSTNVACDAQKAVYDILGVVLQLPEDEALPLLDKFFDIANAASLEPITAYPVEYKDARPIHVRRERWFENMFIGVVSQVLHVSMRLKKDPYDNWDKFFAFFEKGTNELAMVARCRLEFDREAIAARRKSSRCMTYCPELYPNGERNNYLCNLSDDLLRWIHVVRDMDIKYHDRQPTSEQKDRIFRRFRELEESIRPFREKWRTQ